MGILVWVMMGLLILAAVLGDTLNYHIGDYLGPRVFRENSRFLKREHLVAKKPFWEADGLSPSIQWRGAPGTTRSMAVLTSTRTLLSLPQLQRIPRRPLSRIFSSPFSTTTSVSASTGEQVA